MSEYVKKMAAASSTPQHEMILECLEYWGVLGTRELTLEMVAEFLDVFYR